MNFANRMSVMKPSATLAINSKAMQLRSQGIDVISLAVGQPDFDTPKHICDAAVQAIRDGFTRYTQEAGIPPLREAVADYFKRNYNVSAKPENTIVSNGGKQSLYNLMLALLNEGDEVLLPAPYWVSYPVLISLTGGIPVTVPTTVAQKFKVSVELLERYRTSKTTMMIFNSPSNPTGACYTQEEINEIMAWAEKNRIFVVADEIYDQLVYDPFTPSSASKWWENHQDHLAIVNGLSKSFAMTGWRMGFTLANADLIRKLSQITGQTSGNICSITQKAGLAALTGPTDSISMMREAFRRRRDAALSEIAGWKGVICPKPDGAFYLFLDISKLLTPEMPDATAACSMLLDKAHVAVVPGDAFGSAGCIRLSYAVADDVLMKSLTSMRRAFYGD
ncbi:MAG: pyridoxal phosphate-dependent aminotransferase [Desulfovibrionaceae bacterium]|nr:pyridoxal phosphate-dependent aminotransferase [Desulfovibrionaceae bacterium]